MKPVVLYVSTHKHGLGGGESYLLDLASGLQDEFSVRFVEGGGNNAFVRAVTEAGFEVRRLSYSIRSARESARKLARLCEHWQVDLIHFNNRRDLPLAYFLARQVKLPIVVTIHNNYISRYLGLLDNLRGLFAIAWGRIFGRVVSRYITVTKYNADQVRRLLGVPPDRVTSIYNGIRLPEEPQARSSASGRVRICVVSRLYRHKGIDVLLKSLALIRSKKDLEWECVIIGDGPEEGRLKLLARRYELQERVHFVGRIPREHVFELVAGSRMVVLPSWYEGFPYSLLEAMALSVPIITTCAQGLSEIIPEGKNGILVRPGDIVGLANAIDMLLSNPDLAQKMGREGRRLVETEFSLEKMVTRTRQVYEELL